MGLFFVASQFLTGLNWEWRPRGPIERAGAGGPAVAGVAFAAAWTSWDRFGLNLFQSL